ncbi:hypothetical protein FEM48_Zijuj10G0141000 [Ziziphus jujuba var. spinosa]|uniref:non-specific serine/threonine protein kinase n=1 Tax=Ziziphus jujuba var. spinosa TaxID=714518 RepID=A0A978UNU2_ZIZJJ|nr:hypothetical protein FEM48_Zijuj10G0141000 [Ziziphus jujuba var. spinosa]
MNQNLFILTFLLFLPNQHFVGSVDRYYLDCSVPARTCPDNQTIRFPFYLRDQQKSFCGYPGFEVSCDEDGHSILNLSVDDPYIVRQISYHNRSLIVSNAAISHNSTPNCIPPLQSMSFPNERFELPKQNHLLSNCYPPRVPEYEIGCSSENATNWVLGVPENDKQKLGNLSKQCGDGKVVVLPVKYYNRSDEIVGMRQVLSRGFELTWKADDCSRCQRTGGVCGFNASSSLFHCYCKDRPHLVYCRACKQGFSCGNINGLRYPFWGGDRISDCGLPEFNLTSCQDGYPVLHIMNIKFAILEIKQDEQIGTVICKDMLDDGCPDHRLFNTIINSSTFESASYNARLTYFYNCFPPIPTDQMSPDLTCTRNGRAYLHLHGFYMLESNQTNQINHSCHNRTQIPVLPSYYQDLQSKSMAATDVVKKGFDLRYKFDTYEACLECLNYSGQCGYKETSKEFVCFLKPSTFSYAFSVLISS